MVLLPRIKMQNSIKNSTQWIRTTAKSVSGEIKSSGKEMYNEAKNGWRTGKKLSHIKQLNPVNSFITKSTGALSKTKIKQKHLPVILGGIGAVTPIPGAAIAGFGLGKVINFILKKLKNGLK